MDKGVGNYAPINGLDLYYEVHGAERTGAPPLVLLHGGGDTIETSFGEILPELARSRRIVAFERQGYGHTADIPDRPFSFEQFADDTVALLDYLEIAKADLFGFSNGGTVALHVAIRHPERVRKLVLASAFFSHDGAEPAFWNGFPAATPDIMPKVLRAAYFAVAPHPENFERFFYKSVNLMRTFPDIPRERLQGLEAPALIVCGDSDVMRPEHAVEEYRLIPRAWLAVLPGTDHMSLTSRTDWLVPMIEQFLNARE
ncbi:MAG TPA: alpha/beta hydrolase [Candidatus Baltobacteraceae bacterium]|jgi:pimeloyl-ACP methyl ester carboxylesterase|nr:alpha/beta hydrolase [Candidatus Baltobacteraceae bacterium]